MSPPTILVVGSVTIDRIAGGSRLGGVVTYAGATFARLGARVAAAYRAPPDLSWIAQRLQSLGIEPLPQPSPCLTRFDHQPAEHGGRSMRVTSAASPVSPTGLCSAWTRNAHVHLGPLHPNDLDPAWFAPLDAAIVSIDMQGLVRRIDPNGRVMEEVSPLASTALRAASHVKTAEEELAALLRPLRCNEQQLLSNHGVRELVVTRGARGGYVVTAGGGRIEYAPAPSSGSPDATGAGDVFFAAWLMERVHGHAAPALACERAARIASRQVSGAWLSHDQLRAESA